MKTNLLDVITLEDIRYLRSRGICIREEQNSHSDWMYGGKILSLPIEVLIEIEEKIGVVWRIEPVYYDGWGNYLGGIYDQNLQFIEVTGTATRSEMYNNLLKYIVSYLQQKPKI